MDGAWRTSTGASLLSPQEKPSAAREEASRGGGYEDSGFADVGPDGLLTSSSHIHSLLSRVNKNLLDEPEVCT